MEPQRVGGWKEFGDVISGLRTEHGTRTRTTGKGKEVKARNRLLFRGQPREADQLTTTLERNSSRTWNVERYLSLASHYVAEIESFTGERFGLPDLPALEKEVQDTQDWMRLYLAGYNYLVYLRQHGFPSPLLDWTESPFIAAYFAYIDATSETDCAVYCFLERPGGSKGHMGGQPAIHLQGPHVTTDKRHFAQKAWYTVAAAWNEDAGHVFCPHEKVFEAANPRQDVLFKLILPADQRANMLRALDDFNINHFTLFHSTDALVRTLASRAFDMGEN